MTKDKYRGDSLLKPPTIFLVRKNSNAIFVHVHNKMATKRSAFVDESWKVSDTEYNFIESERYVHPPARAMAQQIVDEWKSEGGQRMVVLKAPMQAGKTSVMRHICYLLNIAGQHEDLAIGVDSVFVLNHLIDVQLRKQTVARLEGVMKNPENNVFHSRDKLLSSDTVVTSLKSNRVLLCDESHYGANECGKIDKHLSLWNSPLKLDSALMNNFNVYTLLISATPFAETAENVVHKRVFTLPTGPGYYGVREMIKSGNILHHRSIAGLGHDATVTDMKVFAEMCLKLGSGFIFVRENVKSEKSVAWVLAFKKVLEMYPGKIIHFSFNGDTIGPSKTHDGILAAYSAAGCNKASFKEAIKIGAARNPPATGIDVVLCNDPVQTVFVFLKEMLLAGNCYFCCTTHLFTTDYRSCFVIMQAKRSIPTTSRW